MRSLLLLVVLDLLEEHEENTAHDGADKNGDNPLQAAIHDGQHEEAAMGRGIVHAKEDGEDRGDRGADHHDGHDGPDVLGHERNGALGDVRAAQDEVDDTRRRDLPG